MKRIYWLITIIAVLLIAAIGSLTVYMVRQNNRIAGLEGRIKHLNALEKENNDRISRTETELNMLQLSFPEVQVLQDVKVIFGKGEDEIKRISVYPPSVGLLRIQTDAPSTITFENADWVGDIPYRDASFNVVPEKYIISLYSKISNYSGESWLSDASLRVTFIPFVATPLSSPMPASP